MNYFFADILWQDTCTEIETLQGVIAWDVVDCDSHINVIRLTWALKLNQYPDGPIKKSRARFCGCGEIQLEGIHCFSDLWACCSMCRHFLNYRYQSTCKI